MNNALGDHSIGSLERRVYVALTGGELVSDVIAVLFVNQGSALRRRFDIDYRGQFFIVDHYQVNGIAGGVAIGGYDDGDWLTYEDDMIGREHSIIGHLQIR